MTDVSLSQYAFLALAMVAWCCLHSLLISTTVREYLQARLGGAYRFYRLFFNLVSLITLMPVVLYASSLRTPTAFPWTGWLRIFQTALLLLGGLFGVLGMFTYSLPRFLGISQLRDKPTAGAMGEQGEISTTGVLAVTRHPWYLAALLLLWARPLDGVTLLVNVVFSVYLVVGTMLEEKKLVWEYGQQYREYQAKVSMLIPFKWVKARLGR